MQEINVSEEYKIAATEVTLILKELPETITDKIPRKLKEFMQEISISDYNPNFDYSMDLNEIDMHPKTKVLLAMLYRDYICSEEERLEYDKILNQNEENYQKELREKYNPDDIFKKSDNKDNTQIENDKKENALVEYKESVFTKFKNWLKRLFR